MQNEPVKKRKAVWWWHFKTPACGVLNIPPLTFIKANFDVSVELKIPKLEKRALMSSIMIPWGLIYKSVYL